MKTWETSDGLPHNTVRTIGQTADGYLWIGTENGLARFDGVRFVNFSGENSSLLPNPNIEAVCPDSRGTLWVGAAGHVYAWNGRSLVAVEWPLAANDRIDRLLISHSNELAFGTIQGCVVRGRPSAQGHWQWTSSRPSGFSTFALDAQGEIWRLSLSGRLWRIPDLQALPVQVSAGAGMINQMASDASGRIWLGTEHQLLVNEGGTFRAVPPPPGQREFSVTGLVPLNDGSLWVMASEHLWKLKDGQWVLDAGAWPTRQPPLRMLIEDRDGNAWFTHFGGGLIRLGRDGQTLTLTTREGLPSDRARCLLQDREGNLWVGFDRGGLARLREKRFQVLGTAEGLSDPVALSVCEDHEGGIWATTYGGGLNRWQDGKFTSYSFGVDGSKGYVFAVLPDPQDRLWIGTRDNGVFIRDGGEFKRPFAANAIPVATHALFEDRNHTLWLGTSAGAYRWQQEKLDRFASDTELAQADVRAFAEDRDGALWIGTHGDGLHCFKNGTHTVLHVKDGLPNEFVRSLMNDDDGTLWIGFYGGGIFRWKDGHLAQAAPIKDLPDDVICHIEDDGAGRLWISTHHGLFRVAKADLHAYADGLKKNVPCITYGKFDGLPRVEFSGGVQPSGWRAHDGRLWFTTGKGLVSLQPASVTINPLPPPVVVESLLVDGELFAASTDEGAQVKSFSDTLKVPAGRTRFEFRFTGLSFTAPDKVRFQYRLAGLENDWMDAGMNRSVAYNYLSPGDYEFHVRAANDDGVWNETGAMVAFELQPHFWQRWWFRAALVALTIGLVWLAYYIRIRQLRQLERLRLNIARDLHDDVGANLASMALIAEAMEKQPSFGDPADLRRIALHTIDSLRDIVWFIDPSRDNLGELVTRMRDTSATLLTGISLDFQAVVPNPSANVPPSFRRNLFPIFKETLNNAARHGQATQIAVELDCRGETMHMTVTDNGRGFNEAEITPGNGLRNIRRRAREIGGRIQIESSPGKGTRVDFRGPFPQTRGFDKKSKTLASGESAQNRSSSDSSTSTNAG